MKRTVSALVLAALLTALCLTAVGCGAPADGGAQISVYLGEEIYDFDPTDYYVSSNAEAVMSLLYEPLFRVSEKGKLECAAAKSYQVIAEDREIVITLRESYWSDEVRVKAKDFVYAWRDVVLEPANPNPAAPLFYDIENAAAVKNGTAASLFDFGAKSTGEYEITVKYREGANVDQLLRNLACVAASPLREDMVSTASGYWSKVLNTATTNGPFRIETVDYDTGEFTLSRNNGYHQSPSSKNVTKRVVPANLVSYFVVDGSSRAVSYSDIASKTVFYMSDAPLSDRAAHKSEAEVADLLSVYTYVFNTDKDLFAIPEVRRALSLAIDRNALAQAVTFGRAATGFVPYAVKDTATGASFRGEDVISASANLAAAQALLAEVDLSGISKSFTLTVSDDEVSLEIAAAVQTAWEALGFSVTVDAVKSVSNTVTDFQSSESFTILDSAVQTMAKDASYGVRDFDVLGLDWCFYSDDAFVGLASFTSALSGYGKDFTTNTLHHNISGWWNINYDSILNSAYMATDKADRSAALHEAEEYLAEYMPVVPLLFNQSFAFVSDDLSGISVDAFGHFSFTRTVQKNYQAYLPKED